MLSRLTLRLRAALAACLAFAAFAALAAAPAHPDELRVALTALQADLEQGRAPDAARFTTLREALERSGVSLANDEATLRAALDLVRTHDRVVGPLWVSGQAPARREKGKTPPDDLPWTVFHVMQALMDEAYSPAALAKHARVLDGFRFGSAANFPGLVEPPADPRADYRVAVDASYVLPFKHPVMHQERPARRPTGAYLAPGSLATIEVPPALVGQGHQIRVGAHSWDYAARPRVLRLDRVSLVFPVDQTTVTVANPLGGGIYLEAPLGAQAGVVELVIRNAVRAPFFSLTSYRPTTDEEWRERERKFPAPWADLQSETFHMQVPASWVSALEDPVRLMRDWDKAMDAATDLFGLPPRWGREVAYMQVDLQLRGSAYHPGYPMGNDTYVPGKDYGGLAKHYLVRGPRFVPDFPIHELGHGLQFVKFTGERESTVNLPHVAVLHRAFGVDLDQAFRTSCRGGDAFRTLDTTAITWMTALNFAARKPMSEAETAYQLQGHAKYVDIARLFGWEALGAYWRTWTADVEQGRKVPRMADNDEILLRLSRAAGADLRPLLHFWGRPPKNPAALATAIEAARLPRSAAIYDTLVRYRSLIPADREAFREFARRWWGKPPSAEGFTSESGHAKYWDAYDATTAAALDRIVASLLDTYFPAGRPKD